MASPYLATSFVGWRPLEILVLLEQLGHGLAYLQKSFNKPSIISSQFKKTSNITNTCRCLPTQHILNLAWIDGYSSLQDDMT
jgi:hypothetical protein